MEADFEEFVVSRGYALLRFAYLLTGDRYLAEDLTQEALVRGHRRWSHIERADPEPYLRKAIVRQYLSWRRRRSNTETVLAHFPDRPDPHQGPDHVVERDEMWALLGTLPRAQRAVLVLRYYEDLATPTSVRSSGAASPPCVYTPSERSGGCAPYPHPDCPL